MFLYCGTSSVSIWSGTINFYILLGYLVFLSDQEQANFYIFYNWKIYNETIDQLLYDREYLGMGLGGYA